MKIYDCFLTISGKVHGACFTYMLGDLDVKCRFLGLKTSVRLCISNEERDGLENGDVSGPTQWVERRHH